MYDHEGDLRYRSSYRLRGAYDSLIDKADQPTQTLFLASKPRHSSLFTSVLQISLF